MILLLTESYFFYIGHVKYAQHCDVLETSDGKWQVLKGKLESILAICVDCNTSVVPRDIVAGNFNLVHLHCV